jgi:hypothetical protein
MQKMTYADRSKQAQSKNIEMVGYSDLKNKGDGLQIAGQKIGSKQYIYVGHFWSGGVTIVDATNPSSPEVVGNIPSPDGNTWNIKVCVADNIAVIPCELNFFKPVLEGEGKYTPGVGIYDVSDPHAPKKLSFFETGGWGVHRSWWDGGHYVYLSGGVHGIKGASGHGTAGVTRELLTLDISNPSEPKVVSRYMLPGQLSTDSGSRWKPGDTYYVHEPMIHGKRAYVAYWDLGFAIFDLSDPAKPKLLSHTQPYPETSGGNIHTTLPLPDRHLLVITEECMANFGHEPTKYVKVYDIKDEARPKYLSSFPVPKPPSGSPYKTFIEKGDRFGPHCIHQNRNNSMVRSDKIYATYCNAGIRIFDIKDPRNPRESGYFIPPDPEKIYDPRPYDRNFSIFNGGSKIICTQDVYVDERGYTYITDTNAGLYILKETKGS